MKRMLIMAVAFLLMAGSTLKAQPNHPDKPQKMNEEQLSQQVATRMAQRLELDADKTAKFVPIYVEYRKELKQVWKKFPDSFSAPKEKPAAKPQRPSEKELEQMNANRFARSRATIDVEETYYKRFLTVLTQQQYNQMLQLEKMHLQRMKNERSRRMQQGKPNGKPKFPPHPNGNADAKQRKAPQATDIKPVEQQNKKSDRWVSMNGTPVEGTPTAPGIYLNSQGERIYVK